MNTILPILEGTLVTRGSAQARLRAFFQIVGQILQSP